MSCDQAMAVVDEAAQFCTVSYRAPELFDPPSNALLDSRTDVWSLGCLLFAMKYGYSPFESSFVDDEIKVTECSHSRVLSRIPRKNNADLMDTIITDLVEWILQKDFTRRPYTSDVIVKVNESIHTWRNRDRKDNIV